MIQWITHFENAQWKVESNAVQSGDLDNYFYRWEKAFVRVTWKVAGEIFCYIDGEKYNFYNQGEQVILEITDTVRSMDSGAVDISDYDNEGLVYLEWYAIAGERPSKSNVTSLPSNIPFAPQFTRLLLPANDPSLLPFWLQFTDQTESWRGNALGWVSEFSGNIFDINGDRVTSKDLSPAFDEDQRTFRIADTTNFAINETSGLYGFAIRTVNLKKGETYRFSANGNSAGAAVGASLLVAIDGGGYVLYHELKIESDVDTTESLTFESPITGVCAITSYYYPGGYSGEVTVNWYKMELISGAQTRLIDLPCTNEHILFEWTGRFGVKKSWWFKKESVISEATKTINLQTLDSGFNTLKDKNTNLVISHRNADNLTQHYLSDIVLSDEVFCYPDETAASKLQVRVETNSFEVGLNNRDIVLTINKNAYDTI